MSSDVITVEIDRLTPHPQNARIHDIPKITRSLERFGLMKFPIVQKSTGHIIAGHGTVEAAKSLGWKTIKIQLIDVDDETALGYLVADNATSDASSYDKGKLLGILGSALSLDGLGFDEDDIEAMNEEVSGQAAKKSSKRKVEALDIEDKEAEPDSDGDSAATPMREIPLRMPADQIQEFSQKVLDLQKMWGSRTLIDVVGRAVKETHERWQAQEAGSSKQGSAAGIPEFVASNF
jgi:ParB-like chromosome segregation protein Spo0J